MPVGSWWVYASKKPNELSRKLCDLIIDLKKDRRHVTGRLLADFVAENIAQNTNLLGGLLTPDTVLVPTPGSGLSKPDTVWAARTMCERLVAHGVGARAEVLVQRVKPVPKSAGNKDRPNASVHIPSFKVMATPQLGESYDHLLLVDDVVTRGTTLMSAAIRLREAFPSARIAAFAVARVDTNGVANKPPDPLLEYIVTLDRDHCSRQKLAPWSTYERL